MRKQIVAASFAKLLREIMGPVGVIDLQAITEDRLDLPLPSLHYRRHDRIQKPRCSIAVIVVYDRPLAAIRRPFDLHTGRSGNKELKGSWRGTRLPKIEKSFFVQYGASLRPLPLDIMKANRLTDIVAAPKGGNQCLTG